MVLRSSFLPRFSHRLWALAFWFFFLSLGSFSRFFSFFTNRWQALGCTPFIEFTFGNGAGGRVASNDKELLAHGPEVGGGPVDQDTDREVETTDQEDQR